MPDVSHERSPNTRKKEANIALQKTSDHKRGRWRRLLSAAVGSLFCSVFFFCCRCPIQFMWIKYQSEPKPIHYFIETICFFGCCGINAGALSVFFFFICVTILQIQAFRKFSQRRHPKKINTKKIKYTERMRMPVWYALCGIGRETNRQHGCLGKWPLAVMSMETRTICYGMHWVTLDFDGQVEPVYVYCFPTNNVQNWFKKIKLKDGFGPWVNDMQLKFKKNVRS